MRIAAEVTVDINKLGSLLGNYESKIRTSMDKSGFVGQRIVKQKIADDDIIMTGNLLNSVYYSTDKKNNQPPNIRSSAPFPGNAPYLSLDIRVSAGYGFLVEDGGPRNRQRPFLKPSVPAIEKEMIKNIREALK